MKNGKKKNTASMLYLLSSIIWLVVAGVNAVNGQFGYAVIEAILAALCMILSKRKRDEKQ